MPLAVTFGSLKPLTRSSNVAAAFAGESERCELGVEGRLASWLAAAKWPFCSSGRAKARGGSEVFFGLKNGSSTVFFLRRGALLVGSCTEGVDVEGKEFMIGELSVPLRCSRARLAA